MDIFNLKENCLFVGRAATAIYLILNAENMQGKLVLYPANICYAAIYPALYAGCKPVFCDVNEQDGNVTYTEIEKYINQVSVVVIPHMYGNPVQDIKKIQRLCIDKGVLLIEDCASAMGAETPFGMCGTFGDYVIYSTGYSKTIDIGNGGFLITNRSIDRIRDTYNHLQIWNDEIEKDEVFFSKLYRLIRNYPEQRLDKYIWEGLYDNLKEMFIYRCPGIDRQIQKAMLNLESIIALRKCNQKKYESWIHQTDFYENYSFHEGAVPWRFCLLVSEEKKQEMVDKLLEQNVPVSDWYPVVTSIFGCNNEYPGAKTMERKIINFPLLIGEEEIQRICDCVNEFNRG